MLVLGLDWGRWCTESWGWASSTSSLPVSKASWGLLGWVQPEVWGFALQVAKLTLHFCIFMGPKKGQDNGPVLITEIVLAVFDSCIIWFISFLYTSAVLIPAALQPSVSYWAPLVMNVLTLLFLLFTLWVSLLYFAGSSFLSLSPLHLFHSSCFLWSCFILYCRQKTLTWPCWPAFPWLCLTLLYAGGYPFVHRRSFPCVVPLCPPHLYTS